MKSNYTAYRCLNRECGKINIIDSWKCGTNCVCCQGVLQPIGSAVIQEENNKKNSVAIYLNVDTTELDEALAKAKELRNIINRL